MSVTAGDLVMSRRLSLHYRVLADLHLTAAEIHAKRPDQVVDAHLCNELCAEAEDPSEPHIDAAVLLGNVAAMELR